jgi:hypothetical protein
VCHEVLAIRQDVGVWCQKLSTIIPVMESFLKQNDLVNSTLADLQQLVQGVEQQRIMMLDSVIAKLNRIQVVTAACFKIMAALKKGYNLGGISLMNASFLPVMEVVLMLGGEIILDEVVFGGDLNCVWVLLNQIKAHAISFLKIGWAAKQDISCLKPVQDFLIKQSAKDRDRLIILFQNADLSKIIKKAF